MSSVQHPHMTSSNDQPHHNHLPQDSGPQPQLFLEVSLDGMLARVTILPPATPDEKFTTINDLHSALTKNHVVYGIDQDVIADISSKLTRYAANKNFAEMIEADVAVGLPVTNGQDARLDFPYKKEADATAKPAATPTDDEGQMDYRAGHKIENVTKGTLLAVKTPSISGKPGKTVTGHIVPPSENKDVFLGAGKGVVVHTDKPNDYYADADGQVLVKDGKISVQAIFEVKGNVDLSTGNIDFVGTVMVHGDVKDGFKVHAGEDLIVRGVVEGAELSVGGNLSVSGGVSGSDKAHIVCKGDALLKYIQNATISVGGDLNVKQSITQSRISCDKTITVAGQKGSIVGGKIVARLEINSATIGNNIGTITELFVGEPIELRELLIKNDTELKEVLTNLDKAKKGLILLKDLNTKMGGNLPADKKELLNALSRTYFKLTGDSKNLLERKHQLEIREKDSHTVKQIAKVTCPGTLFPGTKVTINKAFRQFADEQKRCVLTEVSNEIKVSSSGEMKGSALGGADHKVTN